MSKILEIEIPTNLAPFNDQLDRFFQGMILKLALNAHKKTPTSKDIPAILDHLREEVVEFEEQLARDKYNENTLVELMDAANFAFLAYVALRLQGVEHAR
jgi:hypothetical protein